MSVVRAFESTSTCFMVLLPVCVLRFWDVDQPDNWAFKKTVRTAGNFMLPMSAYAGGGMTLTAMCHTTTYVKWAYESYIPHDREYFLFGEVFKHFHRVKKIKHIACPMSLLNIMR